MLEAREQLDTDKAAALAAKIVVKEDKAALKAAKGAKVGSASWSPQGVRVGCLPAIILGRCMKRTVRVSGFRQG